MTCNLLTRTLIATTLLATTTPCLAAEPAVPAAPAGAMAGDREMTCEAVAAERTAIGTAVADSGERRRSGAKLRRGLFGFARTVASVAIPGAAAGLGGASLLGSVAAQAAGQTASEAVASVDVAAAPVQAEPTEEQQARLQRLDAIAAYRQCGA